VSLSGSPTVSPITAALWASVLLACTTPSTTRFPASIYFLALSHAPPELENEIAIYTPDTIEPAKSPHTPLAPNKNPIANGDIITSSPGPAIALKDDLVEI